MDTVTWGVAVVAVLLGIAWYLSTALPVYDRLHARVEGALSPHRPAGPACGGHPRLAPAPSTRRSGLILAGAASESLEAHNGRAGEDLLEGQHFAGREVIESDLTAALKVALTPAVVVQLRGGQERQGEPPWQVMEAARARVALAHQVPQRARSRDVQRMPQSGGAAGSGWRATRTCRRPSSSATSCPAPRGTRAPRGTGSIATTEPCGSSREGVLD